MVIQNQYDVRLTFTSRVGLFAHSNTSNKSYDFKFILGHHISYGYINCCHNPLLLTKASSECQHTRC